MSFWHSLYLYSDKHDIDAILKDILQSLEYTLYDPFSSVPGKIYKETVKMFVVPQVGKWVRLLGEFDEQVILQLSQHGLVVSILLEDDMATISAYHQGGDIDFVIALAPHFKPSCTPDQLKTALLSEIDVESKQADIVPMDLLPDDVQSMAEGLKSKHINKMFNKMLNRVMGGDEQEAARDLLTKGQINWNSEGGQRIHSIMACLEIMDEWRTPDFITLRDAYQVHMRRQRNPNAMLYPGDAEAMHAVPNALDYHPIYAGKGGN